MRRVLILAPHFPPADTVDMHRVRMTVGHYTANGWDPVVLCVRAEDTGRLIDPSLIQTVPAEVRVEAAAVPRNLIFSSLGVNALGLRAGGALYRAGAQLLQREAFDLVFISTTSFPLMHLGVRWKRRFGTPFVLDFQDPWATYPESGKAFFRKGLRHVLMRAIHRRLERKTAPEAAGLIAVSQTYIDLLRTAYPQIATKPACLSPFGWSRADFDAAQRVGQVSPALKSASGEGTVTCLFAGRVAPAMERALANLFSIVAEARAAGVSTFQRLRFVFVGTGYGGGVTERMASRLAEAAGIADQITELSERIPLLDAWRSSLEADCLLVLGSEDAGYIPSKLNAILSLRKPLICAAPRNCLVYEETKDITTVVAISPDIEPQTVELADRLKALLAGGGDYQERQLRCQPNEAHECARIDCALFDKALEAASPP